MRAVGTVGTWTRRRVRVATMLLVGVAWPIAAAAQASGQAAAPASTAPTVRVGGTIFADYTITDAPKVRDAAGQDVTGHAFNLTRAYINVSGSVNSTVSFRITPDIVRQNDTNVSGSLVFRLKFAYFNIALAGDRSIRAGMQQTPFVDGQESVYRYRFQGLSWAEQDGALASADLGVSFRTPLGKWGDAHVGLYNGEGYNRPELNNTKALMTRVTLRPIPDHAVAKGLRLTGYYHADSYVNDAPRTRIMASAWFEHRRFNAGVDVLRKIDQTTPAATKVTAEGMSIFVTPFLREKGRGVEGLFRLDLFDPNVNVAGSQRRVIAGVAYWFPRQGSTNYALMGNMEQLSYRGGATARATDRKFSVHALIGF